MEHASSDSNTSTIRLLLVDDEENILLSLKRLFRSSGYEILTATSAMQALDLMAAQQSTIDVVISDMRMPQMDGAEFLEQVSKRWPDTIRILLTGYADLSSTVAAVNKGGIYRYVSKPWEDSDIKLTVLRGLERKQLEDERRRLELLARVQNEELKQLNDNLEKRVASRTAEVNQMMAFLEKANEALKRQYRESIKVFATLMEMREGSVAGHSRRVAEMARKLAINLGINEDSAQQVLYAALLHDIGKLCLPDALLNKPIDSLTTEDTAQIAKHPLMGQAVLMSLEPLREAATLIRGHHEQYDGRGFPEGLRGENIPLGARIVAVVNDYDALQLGTIFSKRFSSIEAKNFLLENRGKRYDPHVVEAFIGLVDEWELANQQAQAFCVNSKALKPGMILARDLVTQEGVLLLSKDYMVDEKLIQTIRHIEEGLHCHLEISVYPKTS